MSRYDHTKEMIARLNKMNLSELELANNPFMPQITQMYESRKYWEEKIAEVKRNHPPDMVSMLESYYHQLELISESLDIYHDMAETLFGKIK
jgi:hypothetical protein